MSVKESYPNGVCPDCREDIPKNMLEGGECSNCGHVFWNYQDDDIYDDDLYLMNDSMNIDDEELENLLDDIY